MSRATATERASKILQALSPGGRPFRLSVPLYADESEWFARAVQERIVAFQSCDPACPRRKRWGVSGEDEFVVAPGHFRHLFSAPLSSGQRLNREYVPHIAAYAMAILQYGYDASRSSLSRYRTFAHDRISKRAGTGYETDAEFQGLDGGIYLHLEVKTRPAEVDAIAVQIDAVGSLAELPATTRKEIEYVLELAPAHFWLVGPGTVDPPRHVFAVQTSGRTARFFRVADVPMTPGGRAHQ